MEQFPEQIEMVSNAEDRFPVKYISRNLTVLLGVAFGGVGLLLWYLRRRKHFKFVGTVSSLNVYPVKSCKGINLKKANCVETGIEFDR